MGDKSAAAAHAVGAVGDMPLGSGHGVRLCDNTQTRRGVANAGVGLVRRDLELCGVVESGVACATPSAGPRCGDSQSTLEAVPIHDAGLPAVHPSVDGAKFPLLRSIYSPSQQFLSP